jgi:hypothetical protein
MITNRMSNHGARVWQKDIVVKYIFRHQYRDGGSNAPAFNAYRRCHYQNAHNESNTHDILFLATLPLTPT